jgi:hypothetical protein
MTDDELEACSEDADPETGRWSSAEMMLAALVDEVRRFEHLYVSAHVDKGQAGKPPEPMPRPGVTRGRKARRSKLTDAQRRMMDPRLRAVPGETIASG